VPGWRRLGGGEEPVAAGRFAVAGRLEPSPQRDVHLTGQRLVQPGRGVGPYLGHQAGQDAHARSNTRSPRSHATAWSNSAPGRSALVDDRPERDPTPSAGTGVKPPADIQAGLTVLARLPRRHGVSRGDLTNALLAGAQLDGADLTGAWLMGANLTGARGLTQEQLVSAVGDAKTKLPDGYERPAAWPTQ
jgi:hypothetical protein